jgi:ankyrin repeat protein
MFLGHFPARPIAPWACLILTSAAPLLAGKKFNGATTHLLLRILAGDGAWDEASQAQSFLERIRTVLQDDADVNTRARLKDFPQATLATALGLRNREAVEVLLKAEADVNSDNNGLAGPLGPPKLTPLMYAVYPSFLIPVSGGMPVTMNQGLENPGSAEFVRMLAAGKADLNVRDAQGRTPLTVAVLSGQPDLVRTLLDLGADPSPTLDDKGGAQDLRPRLATQEDRDALAPFSTTDNDFLKRVGLNVPRRLRVAAVDALQKEIQAIFDQSARSGIESKLAQHCPLPGYLQALVLEFLHTEKPGVEEARTVTSPVKPSPVKNAQESKSRVESREPQGAGAGTESKAVPGGTELNQALQRRDWQKVKDLLKDGLNVNTEIAGGETMLHLAARTGSVELAELLLAQKDLNADLLDRHDETALQVAFGAGQVEVSMLLMGPVQNLEIRSLESPAWAEEVDPGAETEPLTEEE